jgi:hypothetical protein
VHTGKIEHGKYRKKTRKTQKSTAQKNKKICSTDLKKSSG